MELIRRSEWKSTDRSSDEGEALSSCIIMGTNELQETDRPFIQLRRRGRTRWRTGLRSVRLGGQFSLLNDPATDCEPAPAPLPVPELKSIALANLRVDQQNPRLADPRPTSQAETLEAIARWDEKKLLAIAKHIQASGLDPSSLPIVMQESAKSRFYVVLEGNRRITAAKALGNPDLVRRGVGDAVYRALKDLQPRAIKAVRCVVVDSREEARPWIELRHQGEQGGAGLIPWLSMEAARFAEQFGGKPSYGLKAMRFLEDAGALDEATKDRIRKGFPLTTLERLLNSPDIRNVIGIAKHRGDWVTHFPDAEVAKPLRRIVSDLAHKHIKVSDVDDVALMKTYIGEFKTSELPDPTTRKKDPHALGTDPKSERRKSKQAKKARRSHERVTWVPAGFGLNVTDKRCSNIFIELQELKIEKFRNSGAVLSRVFLELSLDHYLDRDCAWSQKQIDNSKLRDKMNAAASHLNGCGKLTRNEHRAIQRAAKDDARLAPMITSFNGYIHSSKMVPIVSDLNSEWEVLAPLFSAIWP